MADNRVELHRKIEDALQEMRSGDFAGEAHRLLGCLGYRSERTLPDQSGSPGDFAAAFPSKNPDTASEQEFLEDAKSIRVLFQVTDEEIAGAGPPQQKLIRDDHFNAGSAKSFLFTAVELSGERYSRGRYAAFTREVNKRFPAVPAVVLFRTASGLLTLAFVHRRVHKRNPDRDVLGSVSLIREVESAKPHRAHLDILAELSLAERLNWIKRHGQSQNFDGLLAAWLDALDTEKLNRQFYRDLFCWFERAVKEARFPTSGAKTLRPKEHVIRLITRLLFVWFIKEKGLIAENLFVEHQVRSLLRDYDPAAGDSYYRAVLQNLFFGNEGLLTLFNHYKFTVEENTPAEQEVALDPELLGKVFENLLATYNPETQETARKQTGSYYTPRVVVDYMVDEALVASLIQKVQSASTDNSWWEDRLRYLLDYNDAGELFDEAETEQIIAAIASLRILDPAVGSGAFPMGVLHKLTLALRRLDPDNARWEDLQKEQARSQAAAAFDTSNQWERNQALDDISTTFERYRDSDFGRKLYLIQNSIYGVDIQPVATQIAKLRFFISLAIEQQPTADAGDNYGIKPLPNLETRFVAANALLGLSGPEKMLTSKYAQKLQQDLQDNRERHFHANTRQRKLHYRRVDARLRAELATELESVGLPAAAADKVARWDPYDQNVSANWFDSSYMFGVNDGFDVVIGNPPYIQLQKDSGRLANIYKNAGFATFAGTGDIYQLFYEKGCRLLVPRSGLLCYITSNSWLKAEYGKSTRRHLSKNCTVLRLLEMGKDVFENVIVDTSILLGRNGNASETGKAVDMDRLSDRAFPPDERLWSAFRPRDDKPWSVLSPIEQSVMDKMLAVGTPLKEWDIAINYGIKTGFNAAFIIDNQTKDALVAEDPRSAEILKPVVRGRDIQRYQVNWKGLWLIATFPALSLSIDDYPAVRKHLRSFGKARLEQSGKRLPDGTRSRKKTNHAWYEMQDTCAYHEDFTKEKLLWIELVTNGRFAYDNRGVYGEATTFLLTGECIKYLCAVLNAKLIRWFLENVAPTSGMGTLRWKKVYVERLPIPRITVLKQQTFNQMIDRLLLATVDDQNLDTWEVEAAIDERVYQLYGLTPLEISAVEERLSIVAYHPSQ